MKKLADKDMKQTRKEFEKAVSRDYGKEQISIWKVILPIIGTISFIWGIFSVEWLRIVGGLTILLFAALLD